MHNLIPKFIEDRYLSGEKSGNFFGTVLFLDISGFTSMTETLAEYGKEGAEVLSEMLNKIFSPSIRNIYSHGGFVSDFIGDALLAVFPGRGKEIDALSSAFEIQKVFKEKGYYKTSLGSFRFNAKCGLGSGKIKWGIVEGSERLLYYFRGKAINKSARAEKFCNKGDIIISEEMISTLSECADGKIVGNKFMKIINFFGKTVNKKNSLISDVSAKIAGKFHFQELVEMELTGEFREVATLFISFDNIKKKELLHSFLASLMDCAIKYGGYPTRVVFGDKGRMVLVLFGAPKTYEDFVQRALDFLIEINSTAVVPIKAGINLGIVYAGMAGSNKRCEYTVYGDTVNIAARFMSLSSKGEILTSEKVKKSSLRTHIFKEIGKKKLKGKSKELEVYKLCGRKKYISQRWELRKSSYVGRDKELKTLKTAYEQILFRLTQQQDSRAKPTAILIRGEAGMGKTRLIHEFLKSNHLKENILYGTVQSTAQTPYYLFSSLIRNYLSLTVAEKKDIAREKLEKQLKKLQQQNSNSGKDLADCLPLIGYLLNLDYKDRRLELEPKYLRSHLQNSIRLFIEAVAMCTNKKRTPLILVLENFQWVDEASLAMLKYLFFTLNIEAERKGDKFKEILFLLTSRPEFEAPAEFNIDSDFREIYLSRIDEKSAKKLITSMTGRLSLPDSITSKLMEKSAGNPFYIEEWVGLISETSDLNKIHDLPVPSSLNALVLARIDCLEQQLRVILQQASVIGREFFVKILAKVGNSLKGSSELDNALSELEAGEFISEQCNSFTTGYIFRNIITREVAYNTILTTKLKKLHLTVAQSIEQEFPENLDEFIYELAEHYVKSGVDSKAVEYLEKAADVAKTGFENEKAIEYFDILLEKFSSSYNSLGIVKLLFKKSEILDVMGNWESCEQLVSKTVKQSILLGNPEYIAHSKSKHANILIKLSKYKEAMSCCNEAEKIYLSLNNWNGLARINLYRGNIHYGQGDYSKATKFYEKSIENIKGKNEVRIETLVAGCIGGIHYMKYDFTLAMKYYRKQLRLAKKMKYMDIISNATACIGNIYMYKEDYNKAITVMEEALHIAEEIGKKTNIMSVIGNMGILNYKTGDYSQAMKCFQKLHSMASERGLEKAVAVAKGNMGNIFSETGRFEEAIDCFEKCLAYFKKIGYKNGILEAMESIGFAHTYNKEYEKALMAFNKAMTVAREIEIYEEVYLTEIWIAEIMYKQGKLSEAEEHCTTGLKTSNSSENLKAKILMSKIIFKQGKNEEALAMMKQLLRKAKKDSEEEALACHGLWKMVKNGEQYRKKALNLYEKLYNKTPRHKYSEKIEELKNEKKTF